MKKLLITFILALIIPTTLSAFELENRIPASVWELNMRFQYTPSYNRAFNGYGQEAPLQHLMLWDREWRDSVEGKLQRQEQRLEFYSTIVDLWYYSGKESEYHASRY